MAQFIKNRWVKIIVRTIAAILIFLISIPIALQIPAVQQYLINNLTGFVTKRTGFPTTIDKISISWFDKVEASGVRILDLENKPMIVAENLTVDYEIQSLFTGSVKSIDHVELNEATVYGRIIDFDDDQNLNLSEFIKRLRNFSKNNISGGGAITFDAVELRNGSFSYTDYRRDTNLIGFNYNNFFISDINAEVSDMLAVADTLQMQIHKFSADVPDNNFPIHEITGQFRISQKAMEFNNILIKAGKSFIRDTVVMAFDDPRDMREFNDKVELKGHLVNSIIYSKDLALFTPQLSSIEDTYYLTGNFNGKISNFLLSNATLRFGKNSLLHGSIRMEGLPYIDETFMNYKLRQSYVDVADLQTYLNENTIKRIQPLDYLKINGQLLGFVSDFVAQGSFDTRLGLIRSDINLKVQDNVNTASYKGALALKEFELGKYSNQQNVGKINLEGKVEGKGLTVNNADFTFEGKVDKIVYKEYPYSRIQANGRFKNNFFEGQLTIDDPNASIKLIGEVNVKPDAEKFQISSQIEKLDLQALNLLKRQIRLQGNIDINAQGLELDSIKGKGILSGVVVEVDNESLALDTLNFNLEHDQYYRNIEFYSDIIRGEIMGAFTPSIAYSQLKDFFTEYVLAVENNKNDILKYYQSKDLASVDTFYLDLKLQVGHVNPLLQLLNDSLYIAPESKIESSIVGGMVTKVNASLSSDSIHYYQNALMTSSIDLYASKEAGKSEVDAVLNIESGNQVFGTSFQTEKLSFEGIWNKNHIDFDFYLQEEKYKNFSSIKGDIDFFSDSTLIRFNNSQISFFDETWTLRENNAIRINKKDILFRNIALNKGLQQIELSGELSEDPGKILMVLVENFDIGSLNPLFLKPIAGSFSGNMMVADYYGDFKINLLASIQELKIDSFPVGNISGTTFYYDSLKSSDINIVVERDQRIMASIDGNYHHEQLDQLDNLNLQLKISKAPLHILEPFLNDYFTHLAGVTSGDFAIKGPIKQAEFYGIGSIDDGNFHVNYLNTNYNFSGKYEVDKNEINFLEINATDIENNKGTVRGIIAHTDFETFSLDITGEVSNFLILNTTASDNDLFYGRGYGSGSIAFKGLADNLDITAIARTEPGTRIFIPLNQSGEVKQQEFINFISFRDSLNTNNSTPSSDVNLKGINLDLALDVTTDAYAEIIFDLKAGDIIRGRGEGDLRLQIDPSGEFNMFGDFFIQEGGYNFTLYNIVNKEFNILPDSRISWYGDPYQGIMDIEASYEQLASLQPAIPEVNELDLEQIPLEIRRKYPSRVLMNLEGPLLSPEIDFDIKVENLPNYQVVLENGTPIELDLLFGQFKESWDEQELNRQVFSLIVLRKFSPPQSFNTGGSLTSSVSELLSNQLSYWVTQVNENLEIDVDLGSLDEEALNTFQLRLSYTMFDGRLRIIRDGGVSNNFNQEGSESNLPGIIGDWTVEYLLSSDGKFRVKMYNRTSFNTLDVNNQNSVITTGFSFQHIQSFDQLKDLFRRRKEDKKEDPNFNNASVLNDESF